MGSKSRWDKYSTYRNKWTAMAKSLSLESGRDQVISARIFKYIEHKFQKLGEIEQKASVLPVTVIHGDYGPWNIIFDPIARLKSVLDFDEVCIEERIEEVAASLIQFCGRPKIRLDIDDARVFLDSYQSAFPLTDEELEYMPTVLERYLLKIVLKILDRYHLARMNNDRNKLARIIAWLEWLDTSGYRDLERVVAIIADDVNFVYYPAKISLSDYD
jgi:Ser/Thr protein kinase RdoA (MazF antagonist)